MSLISWRWLPREPPLPPLALYARGETAVRLARHLLARPTPSLSGVSTDDALVVLGTAEHLPWVDGGCYLGTAPQAPALRLPTTRRPSVPEDLLQRALLARARPGDSPLAVVEDRVLPLGDALPLHLPLLEAWLARVAR